MLIVDEDAHVVGVLPIFMLQKKAQVANDKSGRSCCARHAVDKNSMVIGK